MSQPAQCVILWITIFVATLKHRGKKGEAELRVWVSEAQDGGTDTKKKRIKSKTCLYRKQIINRTSHHAKKKEEKNPTETWSAASAGRLEQLQGRDCSHTSYLIATDQPGCVSTHTQEYLPTWIIHSIRLSLRAHSQSHFTEHYSFATDAV